VGGGLVGPLPDQGFGKPQGAGRIARRSSRVASAVPTGSWPGFCSKAWRSSARPCSDCWLPMRAKPIWAEPGRGATGPGGRLQGLGRLAEAALLHAHGGEGGEHLRVGVAGAQQGSSRSATRALLPAAR
jgi:hypothetical protein